MPTTPASRATRPRSRSPGGSASSRSGTRSSATNPTCSTTNEHGPTEELLRRGVWAGGREVAIKLIKPGRAGSPTAAARLRAEAGRLRECASPSLIGIYDHGELDGRPYLVMELADGGSLDARLVAGAPSDPWITARVALALADALGPLHARGLLHGDVHPANLLIVGASDGATLLGEEERLVLCDLEMVLDTTADTRGTRTLGAPRYGAPELADPSSSVTIAADVHACAAVLWAVVPGGSPPSHEELHDALTEIPPWWADVFRAGLCTDPSARCSSVHDLAVAVISAIDVDLRNAGLDPVGPSIGLG